MAHVQAWHQPLYSTRNLNEHGWWSKLLKVSCALHLCIRWIFYTKFQITLISLAETTAASILCYPCSYSKMNKSAEFCKLNKRGRYRLLYHSVTAEVAVQTDKNMQLQFSALCEWCMCVSAVCVSLFSDWHQWVMTFLPDTFFTTSSVCSLVRGSHCENTVVY